MDRSCPECGAPLQRDPGGSHRLDCAACGGHLLGLSPFEQLLAEGVGSRLWVASKDGVPGGPCPWCSRAMTAPVESDPAGTDWPPGLLMCHLCQQVWVPAGARPWMAAHASPTGAGLYGAGAAVAPALTECPTCGAPLEPDDMGRCRYCRAQVAAPRPVVVELQPAADPLGGGLLSGLARFLDSPL